MKRITYILFTAFILSISCDNDDDTPQDPLDQLPAATQIGANTFGCLLDGEVFLPGQGNLTLDAVYQNINGEFFFSVQGNKRNTENDLLRIGLATLNFELQENAAYQLLENQNGNATGAYFIRTEMYYTSVQNSGELTITHLDEENQTVSGTFWFDVQDQEDVLHEIREGRFDMQYTQ